MRNICTTLQGIIKLYSRNEVADLKWRQKIVYTIINSLDSFCELINVHECLQPGEGRLGIAGITFFFIHFLYNKQT